MYSQTKLFICSICLSRQISPSIASLCTQNQPFHRQQTLLARKPWLVGGESMLIIPCSSLLKFPSMNSNGDELAYKVVPLGYGVPYPRGTLHRSRGVRCSTPTSLPIRAGHLYIALFFTCIYISFEKPLFRFFRWFKVNTLKLGHGHQIVRVFR